MRFLKRKVFIEHSFLQIALYWLFLAFTIQVQLNVPGVVTIKKKKKTNSKVYEYPLGSSTILAEKQESKLIMVSLSSFVSFCLRAAI